MHDLTFCQEILNALSEKHKKLAKNHTIKAANVSISPLSHVTPETLRETFAVMVKETPFKRIKLNIATLQLGIKCESCKKGFLVDRPTFECPQCHSQALNLIYQKEFIVDSIETSKSPKKASKKRASKRPKKRR
jgi:hydrogenase nickel incorporation protein HypA/HybF